MIQLATNEELEKEKITKEKTIRVNYLEIFLATNGTQSTSQPLIPMFKRENCHVLSLKMKTLFKSQELWDMVENRKWDARALLSITLDDEIFLRIKKINRCKVYFLKCLSLLVIFTWKYIWWSYYKQNYNMQDVDEST